MLSQRHGVTWKGRNYDPSDWDTCDLPDFCLSAATACLYGITEAAVLAAGYTPAVGFIHTGKPLSFVYDIADLSNSICCPPGLPDRLTNALTAGYLSVT